jgi:hypothetical protein
MQQMRAQHHQNMGQLLGTQRQQLVQEGRAAIEQQRQAGGAALQMQGQQAQAAIARERQGGRAALQMQGQQAQAAIAREKTQRGQAQVDTQRAREASAGAQRTVASLRQDAAAAKAQYSQTIAGMKSEIARIRAQPGPTVEKDAQIKQLKADAEATKTESLRRIRVQAMQIKQLRRGGRIRARALQAAQARAAGPQPATAGAVQQPQAVRREEPAEVGFGRMPRLPSFRADEPVPGLPSERSSIKSSEVSSVRAEPTSAARTESQRLLDDAKRQIAQLRSEIDAGKGANTQLRTEMKEAADKLREAGPTEQTKILREELTTIRRDIREGGGRAAPAAAGPIITVSAPGGGGAAGGGSSSSSGGAGGGSGAAGAGGRGTDLSGIVEAVKALAEKVGEGKKKPAAGSKKGITQARKRYTDVRKTKLAEMRSLKSKRIREFNTKTKKMPKAQRDKARRAFKAKVEAQFREISKKFPTARGMKTVGVVRELIAKMQKIRLPRA